MQQIRYYWHQLRQSVYFFPVIGLVIFVLTNLVLVAGVLVVRYRNQTQVTTADPTPSPSPSPTPTPSPTPDLGPITTPSITTRPTTTPVPTPTPSPSPTPTPVTEERVGFIQPNDRENLNDTNITVSLEVETNSNVSSLDLLVDGQVKHSFNNTPYTVSIYLESGKHTLKARANLSNGETLESGEVRIGVGGVDWDEPDPTPTPSPSPSASPSASPES